MSTSVKNLDVADNSDTQSDTFSQLAFEVAKVASHDITKKSPEVRQGEGLHALDEDQIVEHFYCNPTDPSIMQLKPWKQDPHYFKTSYVSSLAAMKMTTHARSGGSIEIMGALTGKIFENCIVVMDCYPLPVEGTETRVNAQSEAYEFLVQYLDGLKRTGRNEDIVGWYHSHPGYGCWLSGIDVATQALNQQFQDPYLAIVVDPERTIHKQRIEIGAFRTLPNDKKSGAKQQQQFGNAAKLRSKDVPDSKLSDFGVHHDRYYSLDVKFFKSATDQVLIDSLYNNRTSDIVARRDKEAAENETSKILKIAKELADYKIPNVVVSAISAADIQRNALVPRREARHHALRQSFPQRQRAHYSPEAGAAAASARRRLRKNNNVAASRSAESALNSAEATESDPDDIDTMASDAEKSGADLDVDVDTEQQSAGDSDIDIDTNDEANVTLSGVSEAPHARRQQHARGKEPMSAIAQARKKISSEISRVFKEPPITEISSEAGEVAVASLLELLNLDVQKELFS